MIIQRAKHVDDVLKILVITARQKKKKKKKKKKREVSVVTKLCDRSLRSAHDRDSLEPGPSRARYFPRDMLLLTTTARERAWRLLKITGPLIG